MQMSYGDMPGTDIRAEVNYSADKVMYPLSLCRKLAGKGLVNVPETDAVNTYQQQCAMVCRGRP